MRRSRIQIKPNVGARGAPGSQQKLDSPTISSQVDATPKDVLPTKDSIQEQLPEHPVPVQDNITQKDVITEAASKSDTLTQTNVKIEKTTEAKVQIPSTTSDPAPSIIKSVNRRSRIKPKINLHPKTTAPSVHQETPGNKDVPTPSSQDKISERTSSEKTEEKLLLTEGGKGDTPDIKKTEDSTKEQKSVDSLVVEVSFPTELDADAAAVTDTLVVTKPAVDSDSSVVEDGSTSLNKNIAKRSRFFKARPNVLEAERRRGRLPSISEQDEVPPLKKHKGPHILASEKPLKADNQDQVRKEIITHQDARDGLPDPPEKPDIKPIIQKPKRKVPRWLETPVSENRNKLTISDLIYMNPTTNPMKEKTDIRKVPSTPRRASVESAAADVSIIRDVVMTSAPGTPRAGEDKEDPEDNPVPQVMIGPDGNIIVNNASLVMDNPATQPDVGILESDVVVERDSYDPAFYYKHKKRSSTWTIKETTKFFVALSTVGTDFSLMTHLFKGRTRTELKRKFKIEEKKHKWLIDKALVERRELDMSIFDESSSEDNQENIPEEPQPSKMKVIQTSVRAQLEEERLSAKQENQKKRRPRKPSTKAAKKANEKPKKSTAKNSRKVKSRYYDSSSESEDDNLSQHSDRENKTAEDKNDRNDSEEEEEEANNSDDDVIKISLKTTRSGRLPIPTKTFSVQQHVQKKRGPRPKKRDLEPLLLPGGIPQTPPVVRQLSCIPVGSVSTPPPPSFGRLPCLSPSNILEDPTTGQRLLLVKSPPPGPGNEKGKDMLHIYLLSPGTHRNTEEVTAPSVSIEEPSPERELEKVVVELENQPFIPEALATKQQTTGQCNVVQNVEWSEYIIDEDPSFSGNELKSVVPLMVSESVEIMSPDNINHPLEHVETQTFVAAAAAGEEDVTTQDVQNRTDVVKMETSRADGVDDPSNQLVKNYKVTNIKRGDQVEQIVEIFFEPQDLPVLLKSEDSEKDLVELFDIEIVQNSEDSEGEEDGEDVKPCV